MSKKDYYGQSALRKQKGQFAEDIVQGILEAKEWQVYSPPSGRYAHIFDFLAINWKCETLFAEVKAQRFKDSFCLKLHNYNSYKKVIEELGKDFILFVVNNGVNHGVYCAQFRDLLKPVRIEGKRYPYLQDVGGKFNYKTYWFALSQFKKVRALTKTELEQLNKLSGG
jgi:hypothetical protein